MKGAPRKHPALTTEQIDFLALKLLTTRQLDLEAFRACGLNRKINHDERDIIARRVESLGTELINKIPRTYV